MRQEKQIRILLAIAIGVFVLAGVLLIAGTAFGVDCRNCTQRADGSWDCKRPIPGLVVDGWRAVREKAPIFQKAHPAVCRVFAERPVTRFGRQATEKCVGSGVLIWRGKDRAVVLTVHHLFRDRAIRVRVIFPDGSEYEAEKVQTEAGPDLGALTIPRPDIEPIPIYTDNPKPGDVVTLCGYGEGRYGSTPGTVLGYVQNSEGDREDLLVTGGSRGGDSGGPILNASGELVAIIWGTDNATTRGAFNGRICEFVSTAEYQFPWADTDKIAPWNAKTEREKIRADAGAYAPPMVPVLPPVITGTIDSEARRMAQDALNRVDALSKEVALAHNATAEVAGKTAEGLSTLKTGLLGTLKAYTFGLLKSWGLGGGLVVTGIVGVLFFLIRKQGIRIAQVVDKITDIIPGTLDDRLLDPLAYKLAGIISGKEVPSYAHTPGVDPWGRSYSGQVKPQEAQPTIASLQAQIEALKSASASMQKE